MMPVLRDYYRLAKPGIIYGNVFVALAAFIFGSPGAIDWWLLLLTLLGLAFVVGSACAFNNIADRTMDLRMARTAGRALAAGRITPRAAASYASVLLVIGIALLWHVNALALLVALIGFAVYVFLYTPLKPKSAWALYVGAFAGATPPVVGYAAATGHLNWWAAALFAFLYLWQLPHFLAIARYRYGEYQAAGVPLFVREPKNEKERRRARSIFHASLVVLVLFCVVLMLQR